jgi:hypothetical protein
MTANRKLRILIALLPLIRLLLVPALLILVILGSR